MIIVLITLILAVVLFATEKLRVDMVSVLIMAILMITGVLTPAEGLAGFSNAATITVAAMFIISSALYRTGALNAIGYKLTKLFRKDFTQAILVLMIVVGFLSAFMNNTPVVAIFIPIVIRAARSSEQDASKALMPLSFAAMIGGICTVIGTSTNILVSGIAEDNGLAPIGMFELTSLGIVFFAVGVAYMFFIGLKLIPKREIAKDLTRKFGMGEYLTDIVLLPEANSVGKRIVHAPLVKELDMDIIQILRQGKKIYNPSGATTLEANDVLRVRSDIEKIRLAQERVGVSIKSAAVISEKDIRSEEMTLMEVIITPGSRLEGKTLKEVDFKRRYGATALAIRKRDEVMHDRIGTIKLRSGDTLLVELKSDHIQDFKQYVQDNGNPLIISTEIAQPRYRKDKIIPAALIVLAVILLAAFNIMPIVIAAVSGCIALILLGCVPMDEAYQAIEWKIIFLIAGALSLGVALEKTGVAKEISHYIVFVVGEYGPVAVLSSIYLITTILTNMMSNNAAAVLIAPIGISAAIEMGIDPRPILIAITFAASASFMTPVGYQTNTMIYGAGNYKFSDFIKVGGPLNLLFWILATLLIPLFFPF